LNKESIMSQDIWVGILECPGGYEGGHTWVVTGSTFEEVAKLLWDEMTADDTKIADWEGVEWDFERFLKEEGTYCDEMKTRILPAKLGQVVKLFPQG